MILHHGTTRQRAEAIVRDGPDPNFLEPLTQYDPAGGLSTVEPGRPNPNHDPAEYARGKAQKNPGDGGPVILEIEIPDDLADLADDWGDEIRFTPGWGLEELIAAWPTLPKRILDV